MLTINIMTSTFLVLWCQYHYIVTSNGIMVSLPALARWYHCQYWYSFRLQIIKSQSSEGHYILLKWWWSKFCFFVFFLEKTTPPEVTMFQNGPLKTSKAPYWQWSKISSFKTITPSKMKSLSTLILSRPLYPPNKQLIFTFFCKNILVIHA